MIKADGEKKVFELCNGEISYIMAVNTFGYLENLYFGKKITYTDFVKNDRAVRGHSVCVPGQTDKSADASQFMQEYSTLGTGDFRTPSFAVSFENGGRACDLKYLSHRIIEKDTSAAMPKTNDGETLEIVLSDESRGIKVCLFYTVYDGINAIARSSKIENLSAEMVVIDRAYSFNLDIPNGDYCLTGLFGAHLRERSVDTEKLFQGVHTLSSERGVSSAQVNPFVAVSDGFANENVGNVYGFNLIYSGNFELNVQLDELDNVRINGGIASRDFCWKLTPGDTFDTPEVAIVFSDGGFNKMSRAFHDLYREHLINKKFAFSPRPIVINNWEATYFDFDEKKLKDIIDSVKGTGVNTFVLDDGWFGKRNNDKTSLGDWFADKNKLPNGLKEISDFCHKSGLKFGLWFEPEMISPVSELYKNHPDWAIKAPNGEPCLGRDQLVLDLTNNEVADFIVNTLSKHIEDDGLDYIKWDMNRAVTENYSSVLPRDRQKEFNHRYVLSLYEILKTVTEKYPDVLIEGCASGGCRFDAGMLKYCPQIWTSDNSDAYSRTRIQYGTSLCYPLSAMSCHVSVCPNHQTGRNTPLKSRIDVASLGAYGYELNTAKLNADEKALLIKGCEDYREDEKLVLRGDLYRLSSPFISGNFAEMVISKDKTRAKVVAMPLNPLGNDKFFRIKLVGLSEDKNYMIEETNETASGSALINRGMTLPQGFGDYKTVVRHLKVID